MLKCNFKKELSIGKKIEMEHKSLFPKSQQKIMTEKIARQHIKESPCYYSKGLLPMEKRLGIKK
jgi:hypothetical protein